MRFMIVPTEMSFWGKQGRLSYKASPMQIGHSLALSKWHRIQVGSIYAPRMADLAFKTKDQRSMLVHEYHFSSPPSLASSGGHECCGMQGFYTAYQKLLTLRGDIGSKPTCVTEQ